MPFQDKPGVDWIEIRRMVLEEGTPLRQLAVRYSVSRQAIHKRAMKEGWIVPKQVRTPLLESRLIESGTLGHVAWKATPGVLAAYVKHLSEGMPKRTAAAMVGVARQTIEEWRDKDKNFDAACQAATAHWAKTRIKNINNAGDRGDWRADSWLLERHPETRTDFQGPKAEGGTTIQVVLNIPLPKLALPGDDAKVIEVVTVTDE